MQISPFVYCSELLIPLRGICRANCKKVYTTLCKQDIKTKQKMLRLLVEPSYSLFNANASNSLFVYAKQRKTEELENRGILSLRDATTNFVFSSFRNIIRTSSPRPVYFRIVCPAIFFATFSLNIIHCYSQRFILQLR